MALTNTSISLVQNNLTCTFTRENSFDKSGYYRILPDTTPYLNVAFGTGNLKVEIYLGKNSFLFNFL
jgi:hypothetical protein